MDWLSQNKAVIVCHEKVVEIPLEGSEILRVQGERTLGADKALMNAKVDEPKLTCVDIVWEAAYAIRVTFLPICCDIGSEVCLKAGLEPDEWTMKMIIQAHIEEEENHVSTYKQHLRDKLCLTIDENSTLWHRRLGHADTRLI
ncbi:hypothetical protein Tco_0797828 [Tanacetum coccineum]